METTTTSKNFAVNESLRAQLEAYKKDNDLTNLEMAQRIGVATATQVSKYLNSTPDAPSQVNWNPATWEAAAGDMLKSQERWKAHKDTLFVNNVTRQVERICKHIHKTGDFGGGYGRSGFGKTSGIKLFAKNNPSAIFFTVLDGEGTREGLVSIFFAECEKTNWDNRTNRGRWLMERFRNSNRLIILDNAQRISPSGWSWLFDFYDYTGAPIAWFGTHEVLDVIAKNEQWFSRSYYCEEIEKPEDKQAAREMIARFAPALPELQPMAEDAVKGRGSMRTLGKRLKLAAQIKANGFEGTAREAFESAGTFALSKHQQALAKGASARSQGGAK